MFRNVPLNYTRRMFLGLLDAEGFAGRYDFAYLPMDFNTACGLGYAFLNMRNHSDAVRIKEHFHGFTRWSMPSSKVCGVVWSEPYQGLAEHIRRFRNSPVMHPSVSDEYRPVLLKQGMRVPFPEPTRHIPAPHLSRPVRDRHIPNRGSKSKAVVEAVAPGAC